MILKCNEKPLLNWDRLRLTKQFPPHTTGFISFLRVVFAKQIVFTLWYDLQHLFSYFLICNLSVSFEQKDKSVIWVVIHINIGLNIYFLIIISPKYPYSLVHYISFNILLKNCNINKPVNGTLELFVLYLGNNLRPFEVIHNIIQEGNILYMAVS